MSADELLIIERLSACRFAPGTWVKRFVNNLYMASKSKPETELSISQREWLYRYLYKYRKQIPVTYKKFKDHPHCKAVKK